jgi:hypothetical protein
MNKRFNIFLLSALLASLSLPVMLSAQSFTVSAESAQASGDTVSYISGYIQVTNATAQDLRLRVAITGKTNFPSEWQTQICFFQGCFPTGVESVDGVLGPGESDVLDLTMIPGRTPGTATVQVTVTNLGNPTDSKVLTYTATANLVNSVSSPLAGSFALAQNYPNPFSMGKSTGTTIGYALPSASCAVLKVYNLLGKEVRTLVNESRPLGRSTVVWDGRDNSGKQVSAGIYMYKLTSGNHTLSRRLSFTR